MKFGNAAWGFRELELEEQLKITSGMGLKIHELGIANAETDIKTDASDAELESVRALYEKYGIGLLCAATGNDFTCGNSDDVEKIKRVTDMCAVLGVKYLRIFAGFSHKEEVTGERWKTMVESLNRCAEHAKKKNVVLVVETHGGVDGFDGGEVEHFNSVTTCADTLKRLLDELDESIMFNYDPANLYAVGHSDTSEVYELLRGRVAYVHLKDFKTMPSGHKKPAACGESGMDWKKIAAGLKGFDGPLLFEYEIPSDLEDGLRRSYEFAKKVFNE